MFLEFLVQHWMLAAAWCFVALLLFIYESRKAGPSIGPQALTHLVNREEGLILDIREHKEFSQGHITDAYHVPFKDLEKRVSELADHKEKPVIVVCKMGTASGSASKLLRAHGFKKVYRLAGGILEWQGNSLPLIKK